MSLAGLETLVPSRGQKNPFPSQGFQYRGLCYIDSQPDSMTLNMRMYASIHLIEKEQT